MPNYITSKDNSLIKSTNKLLTSSKYRRESGLFVLEGLRLCSDAEANNYKIKVLFVSENFLDKNINFDFDGFKAEEKYIVNDSVLSKISDTVSPQGIVCIVNSPDKIGTLQNGAYIALENVQDPANIGAIARTAEALGAKGLIVSENSCDPYSSKALRAGMGAMLRIPVIVTEDFASFLSDAKKSHTLYAAVLQENSKFLKEIKFEENSIVLVGNEANGLTDKAVELSDYAVKIEMKGKAESLNASVAASILLWEILK